MGRALTRRHGLRLYSADTQTWVHRDRALAAGHSGARRWEQMTIEERQNLAPDDVFDLWIHWERGPMIVEDVGGLPRSPMVVAEGTTVPADRTPALWLLRRSAWADNAVFRHFAAAILEEGERHGVPVIANDGPLEAAIAQVERHFADELARGPKAETVEERRALIREANEALAFQVRTGTARPWATATPETMTRNFLCECDDRECRDVVVLPVAEWERRARAGPVV